MSVKYLTPFQCLPFLEVLEADGSNVWHVWVWRRRRATLNGWIFQARVCPFGWPWCPWCPGQMNERGCEPSDPFILVHPWLNPRCANVSWNGQHRNWWFGAFFSSIISKIEEVWRIDICPWSMLTWFAFHFFEQKNRVKLTGCVAQEWEDSSLRDTKVGTPYYGGLRVPLCQQHVSVSYWATGVGRSKGSDLPILSIKFVFASWHTRKLCTKIQLSSKEILLKENNKVFLWSFWSSLKIGRTHSIVHLATVCRF